MGYARLPGEPLMRERFDRLKDDEAVLAGVAEDLALFLRALHAIAPAEHGLAPAGEGALAEWTRMGEEFREKLFPYMRSDARETVARNFEWALNDADMWHYDECLIHGDFGTGNILFGDGRVSGVIDFGFCGPGDPAQDLGALLASYGEAFVERVCRHYPALRAGCPARAFIRAITRWFKRSSPCAMAMKPSLKTECAIMFRISHRGTEDAREFATEAVN